MPERWPPSCCEWWRKAVPRTVSPFLIRDVGARAGERGYTPIQRAFAVRNGVERFRVPCVSQDRSICRRCGRTLAMITSQHPVKSVTDAGSSRARQVRKQVDPS